MRGWLAAPIVATLLVAGSPAPGSAQSCGDFISQKAAQQHLEQTGDLSGQLDPDLNGFACEGAGFVTDSLLVAQEAPPTNQVIINNDAPSQSDSAAGASNVRVERNPGRQAAIGNDGTGNSVERVRPDRSRPDRNRPDRGSGDTGAAPDGFVPEGDGEFTGDDLAAAGEALAEGQALPIALPNTGAGPTTRGDGTVWAVVGALILGGAVVAGRRFGRVG